MGPGMSRGWSVNEQIVDERLSCFCYFEDTWFCFPHLSCPLSILSFLPPFSLSPSPSPFPPLSPYSYCFLTLKLFSHCFHTSHHLSFLTNPYLYGCIQLQDSKSNQYTKDEIFNSFKTIHKPITIQD